MGGAESNLMLRHPYGRGEMLRTRVREFAIIIGWCRDANIYSASCGLKLHGF